MTKIIKTKLSKTDSVSNERVFMQLYRKCETYYGVNNAIVKELTLCNIETGQVLTESEKTSAGISQPLVIYLGIMSILQSVLTPLGVSQTPVELPFQIDASSRKDAFDKFPALIAEMQADIREQEEEIIADLKKMESEQSAKKLYIPNAAESEAINKRSGLIL